MKIKSKISWLLLFIIGMVTILSPLSAVAQDAKTDLALRLVGDYYSKVKAGEDNRFFLEIRNIGNKAVTNIRLSSDKLDGWIIEFSPAEISYLGPESIQTVDINVKPPAKIGRGDYRFTVIAEATEIRKAETIWVRVDSDSFWLWVGAIVGAIVIAAFIFIFIRFGRQ